MNNSPKKHIFILKFRLLFLPSKRFLVAIILPTIPGQLSILDFPVPTTIYNMYKSVSSPLCTSRKGCKLERGRGGNFWSQPLAAESKGWENENF